jgi:hypothetical protein
MAESRILTAEYCDDVRQEVGNKISLMGCYGSDMVVPTVPIHLPKLCVAVMARTPFDRPFKAGILRVYRDDQVIVEMPIDPEHEGLPPIRDRPDPRWHVLRAVIALSPFPVEKACVLKVMLDTEGEEIVGPRLFIQVGATPVTNNSSH